MTRPEAALSARGLRVSLGAGAQRREVLHGLDLELPRGRWTAVVGPNGAGKSTLLKACAGLLPCAGTVSLLGRELRAMPARERARSLAWLAQGGGAEGADDLTVRDVALLGRLPHQAWLAPAGPADHAAVERALRQTGAWDWRERALGALSGGERQRVLLARLLAVEAEVMLMDEPLANLDPPHQADWIALVGELVRAGRTVVSVLHEINVALRADELVVVAQGHVVHTGATGDPVTHRAVQQVFEDRLVVHRVAGQWVALSEAPLFALGSSTGAASTSSARTEVGGSGGGGGASTSSARTGGGGSGGGEEASTSSARTEWGSARTEWGSARTERGSAWTERGLRRTEPATGGGAGCLMVLGTSSGAGKSWLVTALCRHYARQGLKVAPFKAQNMSNNARVVPAPDGGWGEIGSAQYFQALAARAHPSVQMNPLLLKPEADDRSQLVLLGRVDAELGALPWHERSERAWPTVAAALDALRAENDLVVIEGAGSPAEINLQASDIVNLRVARHADARCLLVTDIDRGGAFAHLFGTWSLLPPADRERLRGFVLNRFRGDAALLEPGPRQLEALTGIPTVATLPMWREHGLPEEDGVFDDRAHASGTVHTTVAVIAYPRISNLDEFQPLKNVPGLRLVWARTPADCTQADWLVLPGSKHTSADLAWLRAQGLDRTVAAHAAAGRAVLGICGGLQMLGEALIDPHAIDGNAPGLGLLPLVTQFARRKTVQPVRTRFGALRGPWSALAGVEVAGYEIHHGQTVPHPALLRAGQQAREVLPGAGWQNEGGNVLGLYLHGLFEAPAVLHALFGTAAPTLDSVFDGLADFIEAHFAPGELASLTAR